MDHSIYLAASAMLLSGNIVFLVSVWLLRTQVSRIVDTQRDLMQFIQASANKDAFLTYRDAKQEDEAREVVSTEPKKSDWSVID